MKIQLKNEKGKRKLEMGFLLVACVFNVNRIGTIHHSVAAEETRAVLEPCGRAPPFFFFSGLRLLANVIISFCFSFMSAGFHVD